MRTCGILLTLFAVAVVMLTAQSSLAQQSNVEIGVLGTVSVLMPKYGDDETVVSIPGGSSVLPTTSGLRVSFWEAEPVLVEGGFSFVAVEDLTVFTVEGAIGGTTKGRREGFKPFAQGILGVLSASSNGDSDSEAYAGAQAGFRQFIKPNVTGRVQFGYRKFLGDSKLGVIEIGAGFGVFL